MTKYYVTQTYTQTDGQYVEAKSKEEAVNKCSVSSSMDWTDVKTVDYEITATRVKECNANE